MTRSEFEKKVAADSHSSYCNAKMWTDAVLESLSDAIINQESLDLYGFGSFQHKNRKAKVGRNAKTGERVEIPPSTVVKFVPGKRIKEAVADGVDYKTTKD